MSTIQNLNNLELKAMRQSLGLTVAEASELKGIKVSKRFFQYLEAGDFQIKPDIQSTVHNLSTQYELALNCLSRDIDDYKTLHYPITDDAEAYLQAIKGKTLALPFFHKFKLWQEKTGSPHQYKRKIYQSVIGHLLLMGVITTLDDNAEIPKNFSIWWWINGKYDTDKDFD